MRPNVSELYDYRTDTTRAWIAPDQTPPKNASAQKHQRAPKKRRRSITKGRRKAIWETQKDGKRLQLKKDAGKHTKTMDSPRPNARASMIRVEQPHPRERPHTRKGDGTRVRKKERKREKNRISHRISQRISHRISHDHSYPESERLERSAPPGQKLADASAMPRA